MAIIQVIGLRHANAVPPIGTLREDDIHRGLSQLGYSQAERRRKTLEGITFDHLFCSIAERVIETLELVTCKSRRDFTLLDELFTPEGRDGEILGKLFSDLAYAPPSAYKEHELNQRHKTGWKDSPVERLGSEAGITIAERITSGDDKTILVAGHAVFTPLAVEGLVDVMLYEGTETVSPYTEEVSAFLDGLNMVEAGAFLVTFDTTRMVPATFELFD
ncbi:MAG: phosphoglycerate mutase family protein [Candidatus Paceibacterota bacterium]